MPTELENLLRNSQMRPMPMQQGPTQEQVNEIEKVRGMQARTEAVKLAVELHRGVSGTTEDLIESAAMIANFITEG